MIATTRRRFVLGFVTIVAVLGSTNSPIQADALGPDFNGDGFADLAISVPFESVGSATGAGAVNVIYGSGSGLASAGDQIWTQNSSGIAESAQANDQFGRSPVWGDFDNDGFDDLAVGVPLENVED